ncbi:hypothetical protein BABINDRAFT_162619 [Babjeviella inositovora NRRL Y-12698]|uniref:AB hydrolase-1 domain-containing protein n=1 Tax=Babjeviella inositovora NRRL Y-12698 TaxID=984486 RepID=A0A1E3QMR6_9ASCO|nr:uncharacterized protein BABINDRAFT_162619 [Babjeviella inositovora NRRL Y-12698]ODQ78382.1 hypothetical protein BABINDRAFT_162619 [Babjeviella inositovora NRRL Y-12698]
MSKTPEIVPPPKLNVSYGQSFRDWCNYRKLSLVEYDLLSVLPFFPEADAHRKAEILDVPIGNNNYIHEFYVENLDHAPATKDIVIVHGYGAALGFFYRNVDPLSLLAPGVRLHFLDLLGFGFSSRPSFPKLASKTKEDVAKVEDFFVDSLEEWRKARGIEKFVLIGHSMGGYLSSCYAMKYELRVEKLILVSPVGVERNTSSILEVESSDSPSPPVTTSNSFPPSPPSAPVAKPTKVRKLINFLWDRNVSPFSIIRYSGPFQSKLVSMWSYRRFATLPTLEVELLHQYSYKIFASPGSGEYALTRLLAPGALARMPLLDRVPEKFTLQGLLTLWMYGDRDWMNDEAGEDCVKAIRERGGEAEFVIVEDAGHHVYLDNPEVFTKEVSKFLNLAKMTETVS